MAARITRTLSGLLELLVMSSHESEYDDDRELTRYVWHNYSQLLTPEECRGSRALLGTQKAESASPSMQRLIRERVGHIDESEVAPMFADGADAFLDRVRDRILRECGDDVIVNRCSECSKIVQTPKAQQCFWCGHDWH